jgi:hypothetical protein
MEGADLKLSTTSTGVRIVSQGIVTIRFSDRPSQHWEVEALDLNVVKGSVGRDAALSGGT